VHQQARASTLPRTAAFQVARHLRELDELVGDVFIRTGFRKTTYLEVRKELRGRYKKHHWPEDPPAAQATSRAKRRGDTLQKLYPPLLPVRAVCHECSQKGAPATLREIYSLRPL
jgi:hypothetical protein